MSEATIKRFLMLLSSARESERLLLYQLIRKAEYCYCLKDRRGKYEFGKALSAFAPPFDLIGDYYQSFYLYKAGEKDIAKEKLQRVLNEAEQKYKDKALLTLGAIEHSEGNLDAAMKLWLAASKSEFLPESIEAAIGITSILGAQGKHDKALEHLERVMQHIPKLGNVPLYFDVRNSYATELAEVGKLEQASEVIAPVIVSPYTVAYPNWLDTEKEIREKSSRKSMVTVTRSNVIAFPIREAEESEETTEPETEATEPRFPFDEYINEKFGIQDKIEDWVYGAMEPNDFSTLMVAIAESRDSFERDMILEKVIDSAYPHTPEGKEAKSKWRESLIDKMKD